MNALLSISITPRTTADAEKLRLGLARLSARDATIRVGTDAETGATIVGGMSDQHLEIIVDRLKREFAVEAGLGRPSIAFKEALRGPGEGESKYGGPGGYAHVKIRVHPGEAGSGYVFENTIAGGSIPAQFIRPIDEAIRTTCARGAIAGHPIDDVRVELYDGSYHEADSSDATFRLAAAMAFRTAERNAQSVLLEPQMRVTVAVHEEYLDAVMGNLIERRGQIDARDVCQGVHIVHARVPLSRMLGYAGDLRGRTRGRATFAMEFDEYVPCPMDDGTGDRDSMVGAPRRRPPKPRLSRVGRPEPDPGSG
jgi:elongation factor G